MDDLIKPEPGHGKNPTPAPLQFLYFDDSRFLQFFKAPEGKKKSKNNPAGEEQVRIEFSDTYPRLKAVVTSQIRAGISLGREMKRDALDMDKYNVWGHSMPIKRARNLVRKFYADVMEKILPPLPNDEWEELEALAKGKVRWAGPVPRRSPAKPVSGSSEEESMQSAAAVIDQALALHKPSKADRPAGHERPHDLTTRSMRRLYAHVFNHCCKLDYNEKKQRWEATWGNVGGELSPTFTRPEDEVLFAGVDAQNKTSGRQKPQHSQQEPATV
jgi:hypothetical protein